MPMRLIPVDRLAGIGNTDRPLSALEVTARRSAYGFNDIVLAPPGGLADLIRETARDPQLWFLVVVSALFAWLGNYTEAAVLALAILPLVGMDAWLHRRTQASTAGLASRLASSARVRRDGTLLTVPAREVVPGDLVEVGAGEPVPADGLIVSGDGIQIDESSLTGEVSPVRKQPLGPLAVTQGAADMVGWAFAGTRQLAGSAVLRITHTGGETLYGEIVRSAQAGTHGRTPLQVAIVRLVELMLVMALVLCAGLALIRLMQGYGAVDAFLSAATLAVAALPEELPVVFAFFLGVGVYRLARRQALVRRAVAVENIGRVTCICSDKTGTLTEGRLSLSHLVPATGTSDEQLVHWAAAASRPESGDPLDVTLAAAAPSSGSASRIATFPFTEDRRRETAILAGKDGALVAAVKGAPETVFQMTLEPAASLAEWRETVGTYAASGHKVIAVATRALEPGAGTGDEPVQGYQLRGLLALEDPVRDGVREAVENCRQAGIRVLMITGDHPATAESIAREIGLGGGQPGVALADSMDKGGAGPDPASLRGVDAIARATPSQKLRLVRALQLSGETVAVTGDGVNDVPALQAADIGIAMGERGTQSAREVAAVVLLDDNFRTIVRAIAEGRQLFLNLQLALAYLLLIHIPFVLSAAIIPLAGHPLLYLPVHIVWLELIIHPTMLLVFQELPASDRLLPVNRDSRRMFFSGRTWASIGCSGLVLATILSAGFEVALADAGDVEHARSMALGAMVAMTAAVALVLGGPRNRVARLVAGASLGSLVVLVQVPSLATLLHLRPLHLQDWALVAAAGTIAGLFSFLVRTTIGRRRPVPL